MCFDSVDLEGFVFLVFPIPTDYYILSASSSARLPNRRDLMETASLGLRVLRSLTVCILSDYGLCICYHLLQEETLL